MAASLMLAVASCETPTEQQPSYRVVLEPGVLPPFNVLGDTALLSATVTTVAGDPAPDAEVRWRTSDAAVAAVSAGGLVTATGAGRASIVAVVPGHADTARVVVAPVIASIEVLPLPTPLAPRGVVQLEAVAFDSGGSQIPASGYTWSSSDEAVAWMDDRGRVYGRAFGPVNLGATLDGVEDVLEAEVTGVSGPGPFHIWSADSTVIAGELDLPSGVGPHPTMIRVHGAGQRTRASGLFAATTLVPAGFALLRYDKRGVGESEGIYAGIGTSPASTRLLRRLGDDAAAWAEFLTNHAAVDTARIGLLGVSQGGWINVIAAGLSPAVRYMINVVGTTVTLGQQIHYQNLTGSSGSGENASGLSDEALYDSVAAFSGRMGYDPQPDLEDLSIPGLWVLGTKDYLVPYGNTVATLDTIVGLTGLDYSVITLDSATHATRHIVTGDLVPWWDVGGGGFDWLRARGFYGG